MAQKQIHFHQTTTLTPEQYIAGLTDFGPGRSKLFGNSADDYLKVHHLGRTEADVTEGSGGIWERLHYDWTDPNHVVLTTTGSNMWGGASGHTYTFTRHPNGTTDIDAGVIREGRNFKGRMLGLVLRTIGRSVLEKAFQNSVKAIEARSVAANKRADNLAAGLHCCKPRSATTSSAAVFRGLRSACQIMKSETTEQTNELHLEPSVI